jgi:hypothetical protein
MEIFGFEWFPFTAFSWHLTGSLGDLCVIEIFCTFVKLDFFFFFNLRIEVVIVKLI